MSAYEDLYVGVEISAEAKTKINSLVSLFNSECEALKEVRKQLAQLSDSTLSALFNQIHWARQRAITQDIEKLDNKFADDAYLKMTTNYWGYISSKVLKDICNCHQKIILDFDAKYVYVSNPINAIEFNVENVETAILAVLKEAKISNALFEQANLLGISDLENTFNSGRAKLTVGSLNDKSAQIHVLNSVLKELCVDRKGLERFIQESNEDLPQEIEKLLLDNLGEHVKLNNMITAKLFNNGNILLTLQSSVANAASKLV